MSDPHATCFKADGGRRLPCPRAALPERLRALAAQPPGAPALVPLVGPRHVPPLQAVQEAAPRVRERPRGARAHLSYESALRASQRVLGQAHRNGMMTLKEYNFWAEVDCGAAEKCWPWLGGKTTDGYGRARIDGKSVRAHRAAWE